MAVNNNKPENFEKTLFKAAGSIEKIKCNSRKILI